MQRAPTGAPALSCRVAAGMATDAFEEFVVGHGELWCAQLTAARCRQLGADCRFMDTREVLVVSPTADGNSVDVHYEVGAAPASCAATRTAR